MTIHRPTLRQSEADIKATGSGEFDVNQASGSSRLVPIVAVARHPNAPVEIREKLVETDAEEIRLWLKPLIHHGVLLATCNRVELYTVTPDPEEAQDRLLKAFAARWGGTPTELQQYLEIYTGDDAVEHLFRVAAGLESQVLGEAEVLGQVGRALEKATSAGLSTHLLSQLFHHAVRIGRRARVETAISREAGSVSSVASRFARNLFKDLSSRRALIIGAGEAATLAARALRHAGVREIWVANRTYQGATSLADSLNGRAIAWNEIRSALTIVDIVVAATGSTEHVISAADFQTSRRDHNNHPLLLLDISVPRNINPAAGLLPGIRLYNVDDFDAYLEETQLRRGAEVGRVKGMIDKELDRFRSWWQVMEVTPEIRSIHRRAEKLRRQELAKAVGLLPEVTPEAREVLEGLTRSLVNKLIHHPISQLKQHADQPETVALARQFFQLDIEDRNVIGQ